MPKSCQICELPILRNLIEDLAKSGGDLEAVRKAIESKTEEKISVYQIRNHLCNHSTVELQSLHDSLLVRRKPNKELVALQTQIKLERKADVEEFLNTVASINIDEVLCRHNIPTGPPTSFNELQNIVASGAFSLHRSMLGITMAAMERHIEDKSVPAPLGFVKAAQTSQEMLDKVTGLSTAASLDSAIRTVTAAGYSVTGGDGRIIDPDEQEKSLGG